jgi:hypothetical protein
MREPFVAAQVATLEVEGRREYLVSPAKGCVTRALLIFGHPASGDSTHFLAEALELAESGVRSYLLDFHFSGDGADPANLRNPEREIAFRRKCVSRVAHASTFLLSLHENERTGYFPLIYVGKNFGAFIGGLAPSFDSRITHFLLTAGLPDLTDFYVTSDHPVARKARAGVSREQLARYRELTDFLNPVKTLPKSSEKEIFFQFGSSDPWIDENTAYQFINAAPGKKQMMLYEDGHNLECLKARSDRMDFILSITSRKSEPVAAEATPRRNPYPRAEGSEPRNSGSSAGT